MITKRTDSNNVDFIKLVEMLDKDIAIRTPESNTFFSQYNKIDMLKHVLIVYHANEPLGCGAIKEYNKQTMEIKRMFTLPESRGKGIGGKILTELENWTNELSFTKIIMQTGNKHHEAIGLYLKHGYKLINNYGQYADAADSLCFEKMVDGNHV